MKILVVAESINVEDSSGSKANVALIRNLFKAGFTIKVLHYTRQPIAIEGIECVAILEKKWNLLFLLSRSQRVFTRLTSININPAIEKLFGFSFTFFNDTSSIARAVKIEKEFIPDLIITLSKGASFRPHYALLKCSELHSKWLAYVHDPYPFHYYPRPYNWVEFGYQQKETFFRKVSEKAAFSAFPSLLLKEWTGSYFPNFLKTGIILPHQSSPYKVLDEKFPTYFETNKFNLLHAGNLMKQRSPEGLLKAFQLFLKNNPAAKQHAKLYLIGPAAYHNQMLEKYKEEEHIYIKNASIPFDVIYNLQMHTSVNIILESKAEISPFLPAKFPHCIEAGKPILLLSPYYSESKRLLGNDYPFWSEADDIQTIALMIEQLFALWQSKRLKMIFKKEIIDYLGYENLKRELLLLSITHRN